MGDFDKGIREMYGNVNSDDLNCVSETIYILKKEVMYDYGGSEVYLLGAYKDFSEVKKIRDNLNNKAERYPKPRYLIENCELK